MIDPKMPLEILNGIDSVLELCFLFCMAQYLWKETTRRGFSFSDWIAWKLPPSMNFAIAVVAFDVGVFVRSVTIWAWRRYYDAGDFALWQIITFDISAIVILVGALCKIRAVTKPDLGDGPWLLSAAAVILFVALTLR